MLWFGKRFAFLVAALARFTCILAVFEDKTSTGKNFLRGAFSAKTLIGGIVNILVLATPADCKFSFGIEDNQVGVAACGDSPFLRVKAKEFGRGGADQIDKFVGTDSPVFYSAAKEQLDPRLHSRSSIWDFGEVVAA